MIAIDLDGTLLMRNSAIEPRAAELIRRVSRDAPVVIASARPPRSVRPFYRSLGLKTLQVNYNGAMVWDESSGTAHHHKTLDADVAWRVACVARAVLSDVLVSYEHNDRWLTDRVDERFEVESSKDIRPDEMGPLERFAHLSPTKLLLQAEPHRLEQVAQALAGEAVGVIRTDADLLQIARPDVDKASAVEMVAARYGLAMEQVLAIGDNQNDIGMLRCAGVGVAVGNAAANVRREARHVVASNDQGGVAEAIERFASHLLS
jgi:Cof subfamily protein (haloacid dehalogenase superfamily)